MRQVYQVYVNMNKIVIFFLLNVTNSALIPDTQGHDCNLTYDMKESYKIYF